MLWLFLCVYVVNFVCFWVVGDCEYDVVGFGWMVCDFGRVDVWLVGCGWIYCNDDCWGVCEIWKVYGKFLWFFGIGSEVWCVFWFVNRMLGWNVCCGLIWSCDCWILRC